MDSLETKADRLLQIEQLLYRRPQGMSIPEIAGCLGVNRSTIWRYWNSGSLARRGIVQEEDGSLRLDRRQFQFALHLNLHEAMAVNLAIRLLASRMDKRNPHAASAVRKLSQALEASTPAISQILLRSADSMDAPDQWTDPVYVRVLETLSEAWAAGRKVRLMHRSDRTGELREYILSPHFIEPYAIGQTTHVIGPVEPSGRMWTLKIERIERAELLNETYAIPADFDPQALLGDAWGIWFTEGEPVEVALLFSARVAQRVQESRWHRSQKLEPRPDGSLVWRAKVAEPQEMLPWVRSWGANVEVLEPPALRETFAAETRRLAGLYEESGQQEAG